MRTSYIDSALPCATKLKGTEATLAFLNNDVIKDQ